MGGSVLQEAGKIGAADGVQQAPPLLWSLGACAEGVWRKTAGTVRWPARWDECPGGTRRAAVDHGRRGSKASQAVA